MLGRVDLRKVGKWNFFAPDGKSWFYTRDRMLYARALPEDGRVDRLVAELPEKIQSFRTSAHHISVSDKSGETHVFTFSPEGPPGKIEVPRDSPPSLRFVPDPTGRWLSGVPSTDQQVRLWDLKGWGAARPLSLRRSGSWFLAVMSLHPTGNWVVASTHRVTRLTFWPVRMTYPSVVDGYTSRLRPLAFSPDGKWLATMWGDNRLRLWPLPGTGVENVRFLEGPDGPLRSLVFDPGGRYLVSVGGGNQNWVVPRNGSAPRRLEIAFEETLFNAAAVSPKGRQVATAFFYGAGEKSLRIWDVETGALRKFELPEGSEGTTGYERGIAALGFADESTLYTAGDGGLRRWNIETGSHDLVAEASTGYATQGAFSADGKVAVTAESRIGQAWEDCPRALVHDLASGTSRELSAFGDCGAWSRFTLDPSGTVMATGGFDGIVRVGPLSGGQPHLLLGHKGAIDRIAISPDLHWVATAGEDNTLRLWPMPDLSRPPLHTLPRAALLAKLRSLTNLRVTRDASSAMGWKVETGPFPGWKEVPAW
jgi:WD40 repeat protein